MILLLIVFAIFAVALPVALEERHHPGDNILKRAGVDILESRPARRLGFAYEAAVAGTYAVFASMVSLFVLIAVVISTAKVLAYLSRLISH